MCKCFDGLANCNPQLERATREIEAQGAALREKIDEIAARMPDTSALAALAVPKCGRCGE